MKTLRMCALITHKTLLINFTLDFMQKRMRAKLLRSQTALVGACDDGLNVYVYMSTCACVSVRVFRVPIPKRSNGLHGNGTKAVATLMSHTHTHMYMYILLMQCIYSSVRTHVFSDNKRLFSNTENYWVRCNKITAVRIRSMFKHVIPTIFTYFVNSSVYIICSNCTMYF